MVAAFSRLQISHVALRVLPDATGEGAGELIDLPAVESNPCSKLGSSEV